MQRIISALLWIATPLRFLWQKMKAFPKTSIVVGVAIILGGLVFAVTRPVQPTYITEIAIKGDLQQLVEAVGTVISEKDLALQFSSIDTVSRVHVKEGQIVKAGQRLAELRTGTLGAGIASASANVASAKAALEALEQGSRPEDIAISQAQVENKRASLDAAKQSLKNAEENLKNAEQELERLKNEAKSGLSGQIATTNSTILAQLATSKTALLSTRGVFNANDVQDAIVKSQNVNYEILQSNISTSLDSINTLQNQGMTDDYQFMLRKVQTARTQVATVTDITNRAYDIIANLPLTSYFANTSRETNKSTIATQKSSVQSALSSLDSAFKNLQDSSASYDTRIASTQSSLTSLKGTKDRAAADISTFETSLRIDEASLALKKAPARKTDLDSARARVRQTQADLARAAAQFQDAIITAPVDGVITKVNVKQGQIRPSTEPSVTMLGTSPLRIEMFVSEVDIPKVIRSQSGDILLDAYRNQKFPLRVTEIDPAATEKDGVPKYRIKLDFLSIIETLKVGMTGDAAIVTGERKNVVLIPARSVNEKADGSSVVRILKTDGSIEERTVETGMDGDGGLIEVKGIEKGETVIVLEKK
jgi:multidrug efflux pump subunit AcrA (membrane-fusion protein)